MTDDPLSTELPPAALQFFGGRICLDFANTVDWRISARPEELIADYAALLAWSLARGILPDHAAARLRARAMREPDAADAAMEAARELRAEIWRMADALRRGEHPGADRLNRILVATPPQPALVSGGTGYVHDLPGEDFAEPLWPVLWSLTALLSSEDAARIGCCRGQGCGWFFVDMSPNRSRLWCSSEICGNRERARRAYAKRRSREGAGAAW